MYDEEDYDDNFPDPEELQHMIRLRARKEFIEGCYEAYDLLATRGEQALEGAEIPAVQRAINRMTAFFITKEEYERCDFLKRYTEKHMPGFVINPDWEVEKELKATE
jgi:hypothetical protein